MAPKRPASPDPRPSKRFIAAWARDVYAENEHDAEGDCDSGNESDSDSVIITRVYRPEDDAATACYISDSEDDDRTEIFEDELAALDLAVPELVYNVIVVESDDESVDLPGPFIFWAQPPFEDNDSEVSSAEDYE